MFPREVRLTFQDFMIYRMAGITYDRGVIFDRGLGPVTLALGAVNGNDITDNFTVSSPGYRRADHMFDNDTRKNVFARIGIDAGPVNIGLFGLAAFTAEQRTKEIGIRKVLGASNGTILYKLSSECILLIAIAFVLASGAAYFVMDRWLSDFQYSIKIGAGVFVLAGIASLVTAMLTISFQALKAAWSNPVNALRSE